MHKIISTKHTKTIYQMWSKWYEKPEEDVVDSFWGIPGCRWQVRCSPIQGYQVERVSLVWAFPANEVQHSHKDKARRWCPAAWISRSGLFPKVACLMVVMSCGDVLIITWATWSGTGRWMSWRTRGFRLLTYHHRYGQQYCRSNT